MTDKLSQDDIEYLDALLQREIDQYGDKYENDIYKVHAQRCIKIKRKLNRG